MRTLADIFKYSPDQARDDNGRFAALDMAGSVKYGFEPDFKSEASALHGMSMSLDDGKTWSTPKHSPGFPYKAEPNSTAAKEYDSGEGKALGVAVYDKAGDMAGTFSGIIGGKLEGYFKITVREDARRQGIGLKTLDTAVANGFKLERYVGRNNYTVQGRALTRAWLERNTKSTVADIVKYSPDQPRDDHGRFGSGSSAEVDTLYHGTQLDRIESIVANGLMANAKPQFEISQKGAVYLTTDESEALLFGNLVASGNARGGSPAKHDSFAVLEIHMPKAEASKLDRDPLSNSSGVTHIGSIPKEWIKGYKVYAASGRYSPDPNPTKLKEVVFKAAREVLYLPMLTDALASLDKATVANVVKYSDSQPRDSRGRFAGATNGGYDDAKANAEFEQKYGNARATGGKGDCFTAAVHTMMDLPASQHADHRVCQGVVLGTGGAVKGQYFDHAWVERHDHPEIPESMPKAMRDFVENSSYTVIDNSNGKHLELDRDVYYAFGQVDPDSVKRYTYEEMSNEMLRTKVYGPWH